MHGLSCTSRIIYFDSMPRKHARILPFLILIFLFPFCQSSTDPQKQYVNVTIRCSLPLQDEGVTLQIEKNGIRAASGNPPVYITCAAGDSLEVFFSTSISSFSLFHPECGCEYENEIYECRQVIYPASDTTITLGN